MRPFFIVIVIFLAACGPSQEEKQNIAKVTCSIMAETRNMDSAIRVEKVNDARVKIGGEPFLQGDEEIKRSFKYGLCELLVLNDPGYDASISMKIEMENRLTDERIAEAAARQKKEMEAAEAAEVARIKQEKEWRLKQEENRSKDNKEGLHSLNANFAMSLRRAMQKCTRIDKVMNADIFRENYENYIFGVTELEWFWDRCNNNPCTDICEVLANVVPN